MRAPELLTDGPNLSVAFFSSMLWTYLVILKHNVVTEFEHRSAYHTQINKRQQAT